MHQLKEQCTGYNNICGIVDELKCTYIKELYKDKTSILIVCNNLYSATKLFNMMKNYTDNVWFFPMDDFLTSEIIAASPELKVTRLEVLDKIKEKTPKIIVTNLIGYVKRLPKPDKFYNSYINIKVNDEYKINDLVEKLIETGYIKETIVNKSGEIAIRGFVVDIFPIGKTNPVRVEFWGDVVESIREFDVDSQLKVSNILELTVMPNSELGNEVSLGEYLEDYQIIFNEYEEVKDSYDVLINEIKDYYLDKEEPIKDNFISELVIKDSDINLSEVDSRFLIKKININSYMLQNDFTKIDNVKKNIDKYVTKYKYAVICVSNRYLANKIIETMNDDKYILTDFKNIESGKVNIIIHTITHGYIYNDFVVISENEIFNRQTKYSQYKSKFKQGTKIKDLSKLEIGDFIVHSAYGIGKYCGIKTLIKNDMKKDYIQLEYRDSDKLYIPVENVEFISKYASNDSITKLSKLGSEEWAKTKLKARKKAHDMADELLKLYAIRELKEGFAFQEDDQLQYQFENEFKHTETKDQLKAIDEIKKDMEKPHPMDRLLCGDVGYGKTEVAFRAIFKAVLSGKQAALLCPTTILASQHYQSALERFKSFPIRIRLLNRFVSSKKISQIIKELISGEVDLLIGTHKILNEKINFKDLGLLVVDEEQRFGVKQKEQIKKLKENIDILTLSATPIPRTLNMSLAGLRDFSNIETPPINRYPVQTYVLIENEKIIKESIYKELSRNGQIFILYNSVENIEEKANEIQNIVPDARIIFAHGRMDKNVLEDIMFKFINKEYDVLICTTIIETGIDIPNANTLIILNADKLGLSQLYQLRGRVGRTDRLAYCYLMYNENKLLTEIAVKRLNTIKEFTELGSGLSISLRDLSIRGAGNLLGSSQSGFIDEIGIELFTKMLKEEIDRLKGKIIVEKEEKQKPLIDVETTVSDEYVSEQDLKIEIHKMINEVNSYEKLVEVKEKLEDRFGKINENLLIYMHEEWFQAIASKLGITQVRQTEDYIDIILNKELTGKLNGQFLFLESMKIHKSFKFRQQFTNLIISLPIKNLDKHFIYYLVDIILVIEKAI